MASSQSPAYPNYPLSKAISHASKIFSQDRTNAIGRDVAARHIGYSGITGTSDKALATLSHYGLTEKAGKGQVRVTQTAVDILHPDEPETKRNALREAANNPAVFRNINESFPDGTPSRGALESWLMRENFLDRAINPVIKSYLETCQYLQQEGASESGGPSSENSANQDEPNDNDVVYGGAKVGDLVQWEVDGILKLPQPMKVRMVTEQGDFVALEGSETGIPMSQVIVEEKATPAPPPVDFSSLPIFPVDKKSTEKPTVTDEPNQIKIVLDGERLNIHCDNVTEKGLAVLMKKLEKYRQILAIDEDDIDPV